ncbi:MAG: hypothetical protein PHT36_02695 [Patescibacteria group bacterium]|nr:hypothetical protein [Patescibacteria group bacterium]
MQKKSPRVFLGLNEIANYYHNLQRGFEELGVDCALVVRIDDKFEYGRGDEFALIKAWKQAVNKRRATSKSRFLNKIFWVSTDTLLTTMVLFWALVNFDVFIYSFASSFFNYKELPLLKFLNKKIIYVFHGTDSRPPYMNGKFNGKSAKELAELSETYKARLRKIEKYADHIVCNPPQGQFHEKKFINRMYVGSAVSCGNIDLDKDKKNKKTVTVLHAPSDSGAKGTAVIRKIVKELKNEGYQLDYKELSGVTNKTVLDSMAKADILIDQVYSDFFLTGVAREAACLGLPTIVGGYYAEYIDKDYKGYVPTVFCLPDEIKESLKKLLTDEELRSKTGRDAKEYIEANGSPRVVAERFLMIISNEIPEEWYYDPKKITYCFGAALPKEIVIKNIRLMVKDFGESSLQVDDKPALKKALLGL